MTDILHLLLGRSTTKMKLIYKIFATFAVALLASPGNLAFSGDPGEQGKNQSGSSKKVTAAKDIHSYSNPEDVRVRHVDLDWDVNFDSKTLKGTATLTVERTSSNRQAPLILDTRELSVSRAEVSTDGKT